MSRFPPLCLAYCSLITLSACSPINLKPGYTAYVGRIGEHSTSDTVGGPETPSNIDNSGRYSGGGGKGPPGHGRGRDTEAGSPAAPSPSPSTPTPAPTPTPTPQVSAPAPLDNATIIDMLGNIWRDLKRPQPIDPAIGKYIGGFGAVIDQLQEGFNARSAKEAMLGMKVIRDSMGPRETKIIHIRQGTDGHVKVYEVPGRFTPILKAPGEKVIETEISTPEVIIRRDGRLRSLFTSDEMLHQKAKAQYDLDWNQFYKEMDILMSEVLTKGM